VYKKGKFFSIFFGLILIILIFQSVPLFVQATNQSLQFTQLEEYFDQSFFGIKFDYNSGTSPESALSFMQNEITKEKFTNQSDPDEKSDNIFTLVGHESNEFKTIVLAVDKIKRTETPPFFDPIQWETTVPFSKYSLLFTLQSGEEVILTQDLLGLALRIEDTNFNYDHYQVGYANIPLDFLDFFVEKLDSGPIEIPISSNSTNMDISLHESQDDLIVTTSYNNVTYLFQNQDIDFEEISQFQIADQFLMVQFDSIRIILKFLKYSGPAYSGVDTQIEIQVGNAVNLIINEELPSGDLWENSTEKHIETDYSGIFEINETFSWYKFDDISKRIDLFNKSSLSYLLSQNLGVLNGTNAITDYYVSLSGENVSRSDLAQYDYPISDNLTVQDSTSFQCVTHVKGHDYSIYENPKTNSTTLGEASYTLLALNQHPSLSSNMLFIRETSLLNTILAESIKQSLKKEAITSLSTDQLLRLSNMYFSASIYTLDLRMEEWNGYSTSINILQTIQRDQEISEFDHSNVTTFPPIIIIVVFVTLISLRARKKIK
jgi:hypothetical protein